MLLGTIYVLKIVTVATQRIKKRSRKFFWITVHWKLDNLPKISIYRVRAV